MLDTIAINDVI